MKRENKKTASLFDTLPVPVPPSLASHVELFEADPDKAVTRIKQHLRRRGNDPVGYMMLAFMYQQKGEQQNALINALKARIFAPGSLFMQKLPYFLCHPDRFQAWITRVKETVKFKESGQHDFLKDIDNLIDILSDSEPRRIKLSDADKPVEDQVEATNKMAQRVATETLASIYERHGNTRKAIDTYKRVAERDPARSKFCEQQIDRLSRSGDH